MPVYPDIGAYEYQGVTPDIGAYEYSPVGGLPDISVTDGTNEIVDGGTFTFGAKTVGTTTDQEFTIANDGTADLVLSGTPIITVIGVSPSPFTVTAQPTSPIAASAHVHFTIRFSPISAGTKTATIDIANDDVGKNPYNISLMGTGVSATRIVRPFAELLELPDSRRLVVCEHYPTIEVEYLEWTATGGGSHYADMTDGEIIEVIEDGTAYAEVFTVADCDATTSTFFMDLATKRLYLHTSNGDIPSHQTTGTYDFCILAYFLIGFTDRMDASGKDPVFEPEIEKLLDGGLEDWTSTTALTHWGTSLSTASTITREETEVYSGAYAAKFTVNAGDMFLERMEYATDAEAQAAYIAVYSTSGGTVTIAGGYRIHTFTESGTFTVASGSVDVEVLVVAGGGGGGGDATRECGGGGGGAGGLLYDDVYSATGAISVTVGDGGAGATNRNNKGSAGSDSVFGTMTAVGGGGGGGLEIDGDPGGSGGGGGGRKEAAGGAGTALQGEAGGDAMPFGETNNYLAGGGGGGADEVGENGVRVDLVQTGGDGGDGLEYFGAYYAGGGGGAGRSAGGLGGLGGGGNGKSSTGAANSGTPNTGGGGGGALDDGAGGNGGKGIVIIRVAMTTPALFAYSEDTIKQEGDYALKAIAAITTSLSKTLTRTLATPLDLTGIDTIKFDIYAGRTGSNIKVGIHDTGGTTSETTPNVAGVDTWQTVTWDISGVSNANKDAIDQIIITVVNADAANTFYIDNMYVPSAYTGALELFQLGIILRPGCKSRVRFRLKSTVASPGVTVEWYLRDSASNVYYNATTEAWEAVNWNEIAGVASADWTEVSVDFTAHASYSSYVICFATGTTDLGEVYSFYLDDVSLVRILEPMPYRAIIPQGGAPQVTQSVGDFYVGDVALSAGEIRYGNDGWWYEALDAYIWHLKEFWLKFGAIDSLYSELGTMFWGRTTRPTVTDNAVTFQVADAREGRFGSIPTDLYDLTTYANLDPNAVGRAIPILFGELDNITPICIDTATFKYKIAGHELEAISAVYKDGVTLTIAVDYTVDLANGECTLLADPLNSVITCKAQGALCAIQDGAYSNIGADILYAALTTFNSPPLTKSQIDVESFLDLQANRIQPLAAYLTSQIQVLDFVRKIQSSCVFHLIPLVNGTFGAFRYASGTTGIETRIDQLDMASFSLSYDTTPVRNSVVIKYGQDPTTQGWLAASVADPLIGYRYDQAEILEKETLLTVDSDAATLAQFYLNIIRSPEKRISATVPAMLLSHRPAEKVVISKSIRDGEGVAQTVLFEEVYRALSLVKNAGSATVEVEAVLDIQSTGAIHNDVDHVDTHSDSHTDVAHVDDHGDGAHGDEAHVNVAHSDSYTDTPYVDVRHVDTHGDTHSNIAHADVHADTHADTHGDVHNDVHVDVYSDYDDVPHADSYTDTHGDVHTDAHTDTHGDTSHSDGAHTDTHTDTHADTHTDTAHEDKHYDREYIDFAHDNSGHSDYVHTDVTHEDVTHEDEHGNITHGDSEY